MKPWKPAFFALISLLIAQIACNAPANQATPDTFATLNGLYTASAQTLEVVQTQPPAQTTTPGSPNTVTPLPVITTPAPTQVPPTATPRCDAAEFVGDVTFPDGSLVNRGTNFTKIWKLKNVGTCSWTTSYALVFTSGDLMGGPVTAALPRNVNPGETAEIQVTLTSPALNGTYRGYWKLRNAAGFQFGIGPQAETAFWVDIKVSGPGHVAYDFAENYCLASWKTGSGTLPCPGTEGDITGFVVKVNQPLAENGTKQEQDGLLVSPEDRRDGVISGQYPSILIQPGDRFQAQLGCQRNARKCDVTIQLDARVNGQTRTLGTWHEVYEGNLTTIDLDLSGLSGQQVKFILTVAANGPNNNDNLFLLNPRLTRQGAASTTTSTPIQTASPTNTGTP